VTQTFVRVGPQFTATAINDGDFQSYTEELAPRGQGWEYIESLDMPHNAEKWASLAVEKLSARSVDVGRWDLILHPTNSWLTIHESIGHPTELDRAMGYEANYAGTSFVAPPEKQIGKLKYGPEFMNIQGDRTQEGSLARVGWDDEGVAADRWLIIEKGLFKDYQTTREQSAWIAKLTGVTRSHGCSFADSWSSVQFQRMPNVSLLPNEKDVVARRHHRRDGSRDHHPEPRLVVDRPSALQLPVLRPDVPRDPRRQGRWHAQGCGVSGEHAAVLEQHGHDRREVDLLAGGSFGDGKGEPAQSNSVSHGCVPARFKQVNIVNTGRNA
jgi:TldD protein